MLLKGYKIGDRVLRHSMVKVAVASPVTSEARANAETDMETDAGRNEETEFNEPVSEASPQTEYEIEIFSKNDDEVVNAEFIPSPDLENDSQQDPPEIPNTQFE